MNHAKASKPIANFSGNVGRAKAVNTGGPGPRTSFEARRLIGELFRQWQRESVKSAESDLREMRTLFKTGVPVEEQRRIREEAQRELDRMQAELNEELSEIEELKARIDALET